MHLLSRARVAALLLAAALVPRPEAAAADRHPLDPAAPAGVVPVQNRFEGLVPLASRQSPVPSFASEEPVAASAEDEAPSPEDMPMDHGGMDHGAMGHGTSTAVAP